MGTIPASPNSHTRRKLRPNTCWFPLHSAFRIPSRLLSASAALNDGADHILFDQKLVEAAKIPLPWEIALEKQSSPVLDLSSRKLGSDSDLSLSDAAQIDESGEKKEAESIICEDDSDSGSSEWQKGVIWAQTCLLFRERGVIATTSDENIDNDKADLQDLLSKCPQLMRLPTENIVATADEAMNTLLISPIVLAVNPTIMSYPAPYLSGAVEFLSNMMMLPPDTITTLCQSSPELLIGGLDGYVQEQSVKNALGSAGDALYGVGRSAAADLGGAIRDRNKPKGL